jgi:6,7-dimethyl-8-ribityllumazine synthase
MPSTVRKKRSAARHIKGELSAKGKRFGIVVARYNDYLTKKLLEDAIETFEQHGAAPGSVHVVHVPGAFEIPLAAKRLIARKKPQAVVTLSVVIQGETKHFDQVVNECAKGVRELAMESGVPVILGMIAAKNAAQAIDRLGIKHMSKGREWAMSAIEMAGVMRRLA